MKDKLETVPDVAHFKEITIAQWKALSDIEKQPYVDKHNEERKAYVIAMADITPPPAASEYDTIDKIKSLKKSKSMIDPVVLELTEQRDQVLE